MSQIITSPSQLFRHNDATEPTHICFVFRLSAEGGHFNIIPKFESTASSGVLFRVRSYANQVYTCELYVPANGSPEISDPTWLGVAVGAEFVRDMSVLYKVQLVGAEDYSHCHSYDTDEDTCFNYIP
jgi:hypothetical protein